MWLGAAPLHAAGPSVTAVLSNSNTVVGQPVQLQIKITGSTGARPPGEINVDGLDIRYTGQSQLWEGRNFQFTYSFVCSYTIMPMKAGTFKIVDGQKQGGNVAAYFCAPDGRVLHLRQLGVNGRRAAIDTRSWKAKVSSLV